MMALLVRSDRLPSWRALIWGSLALLLLVPLVAMRFTPEVNWTGFDFLVAAALLSAAGLGFEVASRFGTRARRIGAALVVALAVLTIWADGAVGIF